MIKIYKKIKNLINKKEVARIHELERENKRLEKELEASRELELEMYFEIMDRENQDELESISEKCSCGGNILSMYDEHPDWIKFCNSCDSRQEHFEFSPILEPV